MNRFILEEFHRDPALRRRLFAKAHRERARTLGAGLDWLVRRVKAYLASRTQIRPARWIGRLG